MNKISSFLIVCFSAALLLPSTAPAKRMWANEFLGKKAPALEVETWISAKPDMKGKWLLIDFWATWCGPCRKAVPELNQFHKTFKDDLVVIGVSDQPADTVRRFKDPVITYYSAIDTQARSKKALGVRGIPHVILVDPQGVVRWEGFPLLAGEELTEKVIRDLIKPKPKTPEKAANKPNSGIDKSDGSK